MERGPLAAPVDLPVSPSPDTGNTGNPEKNDTGKSPLILANESDDLLAVLANRELGNERINPGEWRVEVYTNRNGRRYWNYRRRGKRGGGQDNWRYGGKFESLTDAIRAEYRKRPKAKG